MTNPRHRRLTICCFLLLVQWSMASVTAAATAQAEGFDEEQPANYAFAAYMGSGLYAAADASLLVFNIPATFALNKDESLRLRLSTSAGFFNYSRDDVLELDMPDSIGTLTLIPGIEKSFVLSERTVLIPHFDIGIAHNYSSGDDAQVYSVGARLEHQFAGMTENNLWINQALIAMARTYETDQKDNYVKLLTGFDYTLNDRFRALEHRIRTTMYGALYWQHNGVDYVERWRHGRHQDMVYELGLTLYAPRPFTILLMDVDRVGLGFQSSEFGGLLRLFVGTPF